MKANLEVSIRLTKEDGTSEQIVSGNIPIVYSSEEEYSVQYGHRLSGLCKGVFSVLWILISKGKGYSDSWKKRGEHRAIIPNIDRKYDRLSVMVDEETRTGSIGTDKFVFDKLESAIDLGCYCLLYVFDWFRVKSPTVFSKWQKDQNQFEKRYVESIGCSYDSDQSTKS